MTFQPGLYFGLVLAGILRFDFLKKPLASGGVPFQPAEFRERRLQVLLGLVLGLSGIGIMVAGYLSYTNFRQDFRKQIDEQLSAIADLKLDRLQEWRAERMGDAEVLHQSPVFAALVQTYLENPEDGQTVDMLQAWLDSLCRAYGYDRVSFMDTQGNERLFSPNTPEPVDLHLTQNMADALNKDRVTFVDFHRNTNQTTVYLSLLAPVYGEGNTNRPLGLVVFRIDPEKELYPYLTQWPTPSKTAETLLVRQDGDSILFLHKLRFHPAGALTLHIPLAETEVLAVKAALGQSGTVEGKDYRGKPVIGNVRAVPDSPWFLVARMDQDEIHAPLRKRLWQTFLFFTALMVFPSAGLVLALRQQRMRYYQEQVKTLEALHNSEEKFRLAFETSPDSVTITRLKDGRFVFVNPSFESILGYAPDEVIGRSSLDIDIWDDLRDRQKMIAALETTGKIENFEACFHGRDGVLRHGLMSAAVIHLDGEPHILNITRDITRLKQAEDARRAYAEKLEEMVKARTRDLEAANKELESFTYSVSHDLRAPLRHINGYISLLADRCMDSLPEKGRHYLDTIMDSANQMGLLIDNLLQFSRTGRQEVHQTRFDMNALFQEALNTLQPEGPAASIQWTIARMPEVSGDYSLLKQVWINLLDNAVKFTKNKKEARIEIGCKEEDKEFVFFVRDNGVGFDMQYTGKLFGVFQRLHSASAFEGTGIGLANVHRIILRHGGRTWAEAEPDKGAVFYFTLPQS